MRRRTSCAPRGWGWRGRAVGWIVGRLVAWAASGWTRGWCAAPPRSHARAHLVQEGAPRRRQQRRAQHESQQPRVYLAGLVHHLKLAFLWGGNREGGGDVELVSKRTTKLSARARTNVRAAEASTLTPPPGSSLVPFPRPLTWLVSCLAGARNQVARPAAAASRSAPSTAQHGASLLPPCAVQLGWICGGSGAHGDAEVVGRGVSGRTWSRQNN